MFSTRRVVQALKPLGFFLAFETDTDALFVRANKRVGLFESVELHAGKHRGGRWGDISSAGIAIALTPGRFTAIGESECLSDSTPTKTKEQALAWEQLIVAKAPAALNELVRVHGQELLSRTANARAAVRQYLGLLGRGLSVQQMIETLSAGASEEELKEARRLARTEGFIMLPERPCYDLIAILIARHAAEVEGHRGIFWGKNPNDVPELNWRFQLLASRLYPEPGWELLGDEDSVA